MTVAMLCMVGLLASTVFTSTATWGGRAHILVVGDFSRGSFGASIDDGVYLAKRSSIIPSIRDLDIETVQVPIIEHAVDEKARELPPTPPQAVEDLLIRELSSKNVVGIIAATTSSNAAPVANVARAFHVPVIHTIATHDDLLTTPDAVSFRLIPPNGRQAHAVKQWAADISPNTRIGVVYDSSYYGANLKSHLDGVLDIHRVREFDIYDGPADILDCAKAERIGAWIIVTYAKDALEFVRCKANRKLPGPVLLSDSAYGQWLDALPSHFPSEQVSLCFPAAPKWPSSVAPPDSCPSYAAFGWDAYLIFAQSIHDAFSKDEGKDVVSRYVTQSARTLANRTFVTRPYEFSSTGDVSNLHYTIWDLSNGDHP